MNTSPTRTEALWSPPQVAEFLGITTRTFRRLRADDPSFPNPIKLSEHTIRWHPRDVLAWVETRRPTPEPAPRAPRPKRRILA